MRRVLFGALAIIGLFSLLPVGQTSALGLKVAPLEYKATLRENERLKGFVDVSNPSSQKVNVRATVQGFKQIDDAGGLQFFDDGRIAAGIKPELPSFELGPREALRLTFTIEGKTLPEGDVYAALFLTTEPSQPRAGIGQSVRVGTILSLVNKNPGSRKAEVTDLKFPFIQLSDTASGTYSVKNTGPGETGFYPKVKLSSWPGKQTKEQESTLVFGGRERSNDVSIQLGYGVHYVEAAYGNSKEGQWVVLIAPWMLVTGLLITTVIIIELLLLKKRRKSGSKKPHKTPPSTPEK